TRTARPLIAASFADRDIDLNRVRLFVDRVEVTRQSRFDRDTIFYRPTTDLTTGTHQVQVIVTDRQGNRSEESWSFVVIRPYTTSAW
ncbi:Ig-like domain-containing protein, partial [Candidatus Cyanaurora vandensis]|uniref:Ig-like domain-containing protein n=1 Tax=Candidatus Cyanaurora vandensis TaxID=2714958 RepID=UPI002580EE60